MADIKIFNSHQPALEAGIYKISISQQLSVAGNALSITTPDVDFVVASEQYSLDEQQIDSVFPPSASMGDFSLVLPHIILNRSTLPWERDPIEGTDGNPWLALLLFTEDELSPTEEITAGKSFCVQHVLKETWKKPLSGEKGDLISILSYDNAKSLEIIIPNFSELPYLAHVRADGENQKAVIVCNRLPKINRKNIVHLVSFENRFENPNKFIPEINGQKGLISLKAWEFFCNDHFIISPEVLNRYKTSIEKDNQGNLFVSDSLSNALSEIVAQEYFAESSLIKEVKDRYQGDKSEITNIQTEYLLKTFRIGHLPDILKHLNRTPSTFRLPDAKVGQYLISPEKYELYKQSKTKNSLVTKNQITALSKIAPTEILEEHKFISSLPSAIKKSFDKTVTNTAITLTDKKNLDKIDFLLNWFSSRKPIEPADQFLIQGFINIPYTLKSGKEIEALFRGPLISGPSDIAATNPICIRHADEALRYFNSEAKLDVSYAAAWQLGKLLAIQNKNLSTSLYKWKRTCYQTIKQGKTVSESNCPVPALVSDWFGNLKSLSGIPFNYLVPDPSFTPFESIRFFNVDETWIKYLMDGAFSIGRISEAEGRHDNMLYSNKYFNFLKAMPEGRSGFFLHSVAVAGWPDLVIYSLEQGNKFFEGPTGYCKCANEGESYEFINNSDVAYGANGTFVFIDGVSGTINFDNDRFGDPAPGILKSGYYKFRNNKLSPNLLFCHFNSSIDSVSVHQKPASIHFGFEDIGDDGKLFNGDTKISYTPENALDEAKKIDLTSVQFTNTSDLVNNLVQKIEVITFQVKEVQS